MTLAAPLLASMTRAQLTERNVSVTPETAYLAAATATRNLVLDQAAETALLFFDFAKVLRAQVLDAAGGEDGEVTAKAGQKLSIWLAREWAKLWMHWFEGDESKGYVGFLTRRADAVRYAIDAHRMLHEHYFAPFKTITEREGLFGGIITPDADAPPFTRQLQVTLDAADKRLVGSPPVTWSQRIWIHQNGAQNAMTNLINQAIAGKTSAWQLAGQLEQFLGMGRQWPRWAGSRLFRMIPKDRVLDLAGLLRSGELKGVAYNALRLARTEIQAVHNMANDAFMMASPWVEKEVINFSPSHHECDICDPVVGANGGVYEKGMIYLPLHPNCMCFKTALLMAANKFVGEVRGWLRGENDFLDGYRPFMMQDPGLMSAFEQERRKQTMFAL